MSIEHEVVASPVKCSINWRAVRNSDGASSAWSFLNNKVFLHPSCKYKPEFRIEVRGTGNVIFVGADSDLGEGTIYVNGSENSVVIGNRFKTKNGNIKVAGTRNSLVLGWRVTWGGGNIVVSEGRSVVMGDDCMLSNDVSIRTSDSHGIFDKSTGERLNPAKNVVIGEHVWIGNGCRISKGATIAKGSVIGQASLVTGGLTIPSTLYVGSPARPKRENIVWSRTGRLSDVPDY